MPPPSGSSLPITPPRTNPIVYANDAFCELTGYDESDVLGRNCRFSRPTRPTPIESVDSGRGSTPKETVSVTLRNRRQDGTLFWNHVTVAPIEAGGEKLLVGFQEDVSDRIDRSPSLEKPP